MPTSIVAKPPGIFFDSNLYRNNNFNFFVADVSKQKQLFELLGKLLDDDSDSKRKQSPSTSSSRSNPSILPTESQPPVHLGITLGNFNPNSSVHKGTGFLMPNPPSAPSYEFPIRRNSSNSTLGMRRNPVQQPALAHRTYLHSFINLNNARNEILFLNLPLYFLLFLSLIEPWKNQAQPIHIDEDETDEPNPEEYDNMQDLMKYCYIFL